MAVDSSGGYPVTPDNKTWLSGKLKELGDRIDETNRGVRGARDWASRVRYGRVTLDTTGSLSVLLDGDVAAITGVKHQRDYFPLIGDRVSVIRDDGGGYTSLGRQAVYRVPLVSQVTGGRDYGAPWQGTQAFLTSDGIAVLQGLNYPSSAAIAIGTTLFTLPPELRPDIPAAKALRFAVNVFDRPQCIDIYGDGRIVTPMAIGANEYLSLTNVMYPTAAANLTWTAVAAQGTVGVPAYANSWLEGFPGTSFQSPRWAVDSWGIFWLQGIFTNASATPTTNTPIVALPAAYTPTYQMHMLCVGSGGAFGFCGADNGGSGHSAAGVNFKTGTNWAANGYLSLSGIFIPLATNTITWKAPTFPGGGGWANYPGAFPPMGMGMRGDIAMTRGLCNAGTIGSTLFPVDRGMRITTFENLPTSSGIMQNRPSSDARGRIDLIQNGNLNPTQGTNVWISLDSFGWIPG